jgi:hypothetical protein
MRKAILLASVALVGWPTFHLALAATPVPRQAPPAASVPEGLTGGAASDLFANHTDNMPPILRWLQTTNGVKVTSLTPSSGQGSPPAYLLEAGDGSHQVGYLLPDGSMVYGVEVRLAPDGSTLQNVTSLQLLDLKQRFVEQQRQVDEQKKLAEDARRKADQAAATLSDQQRQFAEVQHSIPDVPSAFTKGTSVPPLESSAVASAPSTSPVLSPISLPAPATAPAPAPAPVPSLTLPSPTPALPAVPSPAATSSQPSYARFASGIDKAHFLEAVEGVPSKNQAGLPYFRIGSESNPTLYMVDDPQCPHCHAAWHHFLPLIASGGLTVKVIMIDGLPGSQPLAISILARGNPAQTFLGQAPGYQGEGSTEGVAIAPPPPVGSPDYAKGQGFLDANDAFAKRIGVTGTPWMAYVGKDGKVYQYAGDTDLDAFLSGLL